MKSFSSEIDNEKQSVIVSDFTSAKQIEKEEAIKIKIASIRNESERDKQERGFALAKEHDRILDEKLKRAQDAYVNEKLRHELKNQLVFKGDERTYEQRERELRHEYVQTPEGKGICAEHDGQKADRWQNYERILDEAIQAEREQGISTALKSAESERAPEAEPSRRVLRRDFSKSAGIERD